MSLVGGSWYFGPHRTYCLPDKRLYTSQSTSGVVLISVTVWDSGLRLWELGKCRVNVGETVPQSQGWSPNSTEPDHDPCVPQVEIQWIEVRWSRWPLYWNFTAKATILKCYVKLFAIALLKCGSAPEKMEYRAKVCVETLVTTTINVVAFDYCIFSNWVFVTLLRTLTLSLRPTSSSKSIPYLDK
jgi:hypothetical protein